MKKMFVGPAIALAIAIVLPVTIGAAIHFTGNTFNVMIAVLKPSGSVDSEEKAPAPDYANSEYWAALPSKEDPSDLVPISVAPREEAAQVDVFFIHPTGFLKGVAWNSRLDINSATEENTSFMLANQASAFNGCCDIYAPRYRQANIFSYMKGKEISQKALAFAYQDVEAAFDYFLTHHSNDRPFILAGHSQGTHHSVRLLKERISRTDLRERMVAAYIIGGGISRERLAEIPDITTCDAPDNLHCVIHWGTFGEGGVPFGEALDPEGTPICTNPLSWRDEGGLAPEETHKGAATLSGSYSGEIWGKDIAKGASFEPHKSVVPQYTSAECRDGLLTVENSVLEIFEGAPLMPDNNFHGLDYNLFYMDIRENAVLRTETYLASFPR